MKRKFRVFSYVALIWLAMILGIISETRAYKFDHVLFHTMDTLGNPVMVPGFYIPDTSAFLDSIRALTARYMENADIADSLALRAFITDMADSLALRMLITDTADSLALRLTIIIAADSFALFHELITGIDTPGVATLRDTVEANKDSVDKFSAETAALRDTVEIDIAWRDTVLMYMSFDGDSVVVDSNLYVYGKLWIQDSLIVDATIIKIPPVDSSAWGDIILRQAGENLVFGKSTYLKSDGKYWKTDADAAATMPSRLVALATISADAWGLFLKEGMIRADDWNLTVGGYVYPSLTAGEFTQTQVSATGDQSQKAGIAETADVIDYNPDLTVLEIK